MKQIIFSTIEFSGSPKTMKAVNDYVTSKKCKINFETISVSKDEIQQFRDHEHMWDLACEMVENFGSSGGLGCVIDKGTGVIYLINRDRHPFESVFDLSGAFPDILFQAHYHGSNYGVIYDIRDSKVVSQRCCQSMAASDLEIKNN